MASKTQFVQHIFGGGWATDFGPSVQTVFDQNGQLVLPFLVDAENVLYEFDGGPHKMPGTTSRSRSRPE